MADDDSSGGNATGSTGYGSGDSTGSPYSGNSETGSFSLPNVDASSEVSSYSNTGAPGSQPLPETWTGTDEVRRQANVLEQASSKTMPSSTPSPSSSMLPSSAGRSTSQSAGRSGPVPEYSPGASNPNSDYQPAAQPPEAEKKSSLPGQDGNPPIKTMGPAKAENPYAVGRSALPFQPTIPIAGSGVKRAFFNEQSDLLKAMLPGWVAAGKKG